MSIQITTTLESYSCAAEGHIYAVHTTVSDSSKHVCPVCAKRQIIKLQDALSEESTQNDGLRRTIVALKGTVTRLNKK